MKPPPLFVRRHVRLYTWPFLVFRHLKRTSIHPPIRIICLYTRKACDTLALDLRGHGTHLVAPETPVADESNNNARRQRRPPHQGRCATAGGTGASRMRRRTMTKAWSSSAAEGRKDHSGGVGPGDSSRPPPPFGAVRGTTAQEARIMVVADQVRGPTL